MKPLHVQQLKKLTNNPQVLEETIIVLLSAEKDPLTFEELYECCGDNPPVNIPAATLCNVALRCSKNIDMRLCLKVMEYAKSKNVLDAYCVLGACYAGGYGVEENIQLALENYLYFYNETCKRGNRLRAVSEANLGIARLYVKKGEYQTALKYFIEFYTYSQIDKTKKDDVFPEILDVYFKMHEDNLHEGINVVLKNYDFNWSSLNWDKVWEYIDRHKNDYLVSPKKAVMARLLFLFPPNHAKKPEADKLAIIILQNFLNSLYPLAGHALQGSSIKKDQIPPARKKKGWTFGIGGTGLDGYDYHLVTEGIINLEKAHAEYEVCKRRHKELEKQLKEAQEEGYVSSVTLRISNEFSANRVKKVEAKAARREAQQQLDAIQFAARRKEMEREYKVQRRFFNPSRNRNLQTKAIAQHLQFNRLMTDEFQPLVLVQAPARRVITAERSTIESSKFSLGLQSNFSSRNQLGWIDRKNETVMLGDTAVQYYQNPGEYPNHLGNYFLTIPGMANGDYDEILPFLHKVSQTTKDHTHKENEIKIAQLLLAYTQSGTSITTQQLKSINVNLTDEDCSKFNCICYHIAVKEVARRMPCNDPKYDFPSAIVQARALKLIAAGFLSLEDVFDANAPYGVVTGKKLFNNHDFVVLKINRVNRLYNEKIYGIQNAVALTPYLEEHPKGHFIASPKLLRKELQETYGAAEDSDGEGYSSDEESVNQPPRP